jgi:hypothetical protein
MAGRQMRLQLILTLYGANDFNLQGCSIGGCATFFVFLLLIVFPFTAFVYGGSVTDG